MRSMIAGDAAIRQSIILLLTTTPGERVMRPDYGCPLHRLMFQPNDATTAGLAIHYVALHGDLLALQGERRPLIAYYIGNILSATAMTKVNPAAGLYAPLRVVVYANADGGTTMEYDRPSSMFGQFKNAEIDAMAQSLDQRLMTFLKKVSL